MAKTVKIHIEKVGPKMGYVAGHEYEVEPEEAKKLVDGGFAKVVSTPEKENAADGAQGKAEKATA
jgi:hypothetical protein